jgi:phosphoribosylanthranilate isomerase
MPLKTIVKAGNISNLSDARYCAGMGVDLLGFCATEGRMQYITPKLFQEIRGWVSGPKIVAEIYGLPSAEALPEVIRNYAPDYFELSAAEYHAFVAHLTLPCIVSAMATELGGLKGDNIAYLLVDEAVLPTAQGTAAPLLFKVSTGNRLLEKLSQYPVAGVALDGTPEIRPGYKDYEAMADILEALDE